MSDVMGEDGLRPWVRDLVNANRRTPREELQDALNNLDLDDPWPLTWRQIRALEKAARKCANPDEMIESLVPVMVEIQPLFDGSYAAPREAAAKVLAALGIMEEDPDADLG